MESLKAAPVEAGKAREFPEPHERVLNATQDAIVGAGLAVEELSEVNDETVIIFAKKGISAFSWGELVRIVVHKTSEARTVVRVLTMRRIAMNLTAKGDYSETIFASISKSLERI